MIDNSLPFQHGDVVECVGLQSEFDKDLNGKIGEVTKYVKETDRFEVRFSSSPSKCEHRLVRLRAGNLQKIESNLQKIPCMLRPPSKQSFVQSNVQSQVPDCSFRSYEELESLAESRVEDEKPRSLRNRPANLSTQKTEAAMPAPVYILPSSLRAESVSMGNAFRTKWEELDPEPSNESIAPMGSPSQPPIVLDNRNIILNCEDIWRTAGSHPFFGEERSWDGVQVAVEHYERKGYFVQGVVSGGFFSRYPPPACLADVLVKSPVMDHRVENEPSIRLFTLRLAQTCGCRFVDNWNYRNLSSGSGQLSLWYQRVGWRLKVEYIFDKDNGYFVPLARATD